MTTPRPYHSPLRSERARQTRDLILRAARRLFENNGFAVTTIKDIAQEAAVSVPTVYATFGSKAGLVAGLLDQLESDASAGVEEDELRADPDAELTRWLDSHTRIFVQGGPLLRVVMHAVGEPGVAELVAEGDRHRRQALERVLTLLAGAGRLKPTGGTASPDITTAVDQAWALSSVAVYLDLTDRCGWTTTQYRTWLEDALRRLLILR